MSRVHSRVREIIHSKANIVAACGSCCSLSATSLRVCQGQTFEIVRTCWCAIGAELIEGCLAAWQEGFTIRAVSACGSMTTIGEDQINPPFRDSHAARASKIKRRYDMVEMSWATCDCQFLRRCSRSWRRISMEERKLALRFHFETLRLCSSVMSNSLSHPSSFVIAMLDLETRDR